MAALAQEVDADLNGCVQAIPLELYAYIRLGSGLLRLLASVLQPASPLTTKKRAPPRW